MVQHSTRPLTCPTLVVQAVILILLFLGTREAMPQDTAAAMSRLRSPTSSMTTGHLDTTEPNTKDKDSPSRTHLPRWTADTKPQDRRHPMLPTTARLTLRTMRTTRHTSTLVHTSAMPKVVTIHRMPGW